MKQALSKLLFPLKSPWWFTSFVNYSIEKGAKVLSEEPPTSSKLSLWGKFNTNRSQIIPEIGIKTKFAHV